MKEGELKEQKGSKAQGKTKKIDQMENKTSGADPIESNPYPEKEYFQYQLKLLFQELEQIHVTIDRQDRIAHNSKYWTVLLWGGALAYIFQEGKEHIEVLVYLPLFILVLFWILDVTWRSIQRRSIYRYQKISEFVNSENFKESFRQNHLINFQLLDLASRQYERNPDFRRKVSFFRVLKLKTISRFYFGLALANLSLGLLISFGVIKL